MALDAADKSRELEAASAARRDAERARRDAEEARLRAEEARREAELIRRQAEDAAEKEERRLAEVAAEIAAARRQAEAAEERRRNEVTEVRRLAELAEAKRQAEVAEARRHAELAEARRQAEAEEAQRRAAAAAEERRREVEQVEAMRQAELAEARRVAEAAEARRRAEVEEARRHAEIAATRREAELSARLQRQFAELEERIDDLQRGLDDNQIEPVRGELLELVGQISELSRSGRASSGALEEIGKRLDEMEMKLNAARNMASNRLGDIQDKVTGLVERLDEMEVEIPGFDAVRVNQSAILERFDRMEGLVQRLVSPDELFDRVEAVKRQMQSVASQREIAKVEEQILRLAERLDDLPGDLSNTHVLARIEEQLGALAAEFAEARHQRKSAAIDIEDRLSELSAQIRDVGETGRTPDLSGLEQRIANLATYVDHDRSATSDTLARLERRLGALADAIENQEDDAAKLLLENLTQKVDLLAIAVESHEDGAAKRLLEGLTRRIDLLAVAVESKGDEDATALLEDLVRQVQAIAQTVANRGDDVAKSLLERLTRKVDLLALAVDGHADPAAKALLESSESPCRITHCGARHQGRRIRQHPASRPRLAGRVAFRRD